MQASHIRDKTIANCTVPCFITSASGMRQCMNRVTIYQNEDDALFKST